MSCTVVLLLSKHAKKHMYTIKSLFMIHMDVLPLLTEPSTHDYCICTCKITIPGPFNFPCMEEKSSGYEGLPVKKEKSETN